MPQTLGALALDTELAEMGDLARMMLRDGLEALRRGDAYMARAVQSQAAVLASLDESLETKAIAALARAPAPAEARRLGAALKMLTYLNRVGRYGQDIAATVPHIGGAFTCHPQALAGLTAMVREVDGMLAEVLAAHAGRRGPDLELVLDGEDAVDALHRGLLAAAEASIVGGDEPAAWLHAALVSRGLERCADNACKIAEKLHFAATGERVLLR
jgi:phosphate transport system protein